jgi:hypothetical protein
LLKCVSVVSVNYSWHFVINNFTALYIVWMDFEISIRPVLVQKLSEMLVSVQLFSKFSAAMEPEGSSVSPPQPTV